MLTRRGFAAALGAGLFLPGLARRARASAKAVEAQLDDLVETARTGWRVPGAALVVVEDGIPTYLKGFGTLAADTTEAVTPDTLFGLASTTKAFTAATAALAVEDGSADWDAPVTKLIPDFATAGGEAYAELSLRHMLSHRTGLGRHDLLWVHNPALTGEELVRRLPYLQMQYGLGERYLYNNIMVMLAGHAVALAQGQPWEEVLRSRIFAPLGMSRTQTAPDAALAAGNCALGHRMADRLAVPLPMRPEDRIGPAGCIHASARDLVNWLRLQLGDGTLDGVRVLTQASLETMHTGTRGAPEGDDESEGRASYALGWRVGAYKGLWRVEHGGNLHGFCCRVVLFPQKRTGLALLTNMRATPMANATARDVADVIFGLEASNWSAKRLEGRDAAEARADKRAATRGAITPPDDSVEPEMRARLAGSYTHKGYGDLTIAEDGDGCLLTYNGMGARLGPLGGALFKAKSLRVEDDDLDGCRFKADAGGEQAQAIEGLFDPKLKPIAFERVG